MTGSSSADPAAAAPQGEVVSIQYLRGLAALLVVFHHAREQFPALMDRIPTTAGLGGVDIFFVISGFVIMHTTAQARLTPTGFMLRRLRRIVPLYWLMTGLTALLLIGAPALARNSLFTLDSLLSSLFFLPAINPGDSLIVPMLKLGWTLNYEMLFYAIFAALLWLKPWPRMAVLILVLAALIAAARLQGAPVPLLFWGNPIVLEFACGCLLSLADRQGLLRGRISLVLLAAGVLLFFLLSHEPLAPFERLWVRGLPAAMIVGGLVALDRSGWVNRSWRLAHFLGDASYAIYLAHLYAVILFRVVWEKSGFPLTGAGSILFFLLAMGGGVAAGALVHLAIEKPIMRFLASARKPGPA